jgi:hypothetical protein
MLNQNFTRYTIAAVTASLLLVVASCSKSNDSGSGSGPISATVAGQAFSPSLSLAFYTQSGQYWDITGYTIKSGDTTAISVSLAPPVTLNTAMTNNNSNLYIEYYVSGTGKDYFAGTGYGSASMTLSTLDTVGHKIAGSFNATLYNAINNKDSIQITNGKFSSAYQVMP